MAVRVRRALQMCDRVCSATREAHDVTSGELLVGMLRKVVCYAELPSRGQVAEQVAGTLGRRACEAVFQAFIIRH
jgi:hypothetical protein